MIVEIPSPDCVGPQSPFQSGIQHARDQFEAARTELDPTLHQHNDFKVAQPPIPVQITGVGFFDKLHGQRGLAPNGIELHPVLDIQFDPAPGPARTELLSDGDFEPPPATSSATPAWTAGTNLATHPVLVTNGTQPHSGKGYARLGERNGAVDSVSQSVTVPTDASDLDLSFWAGIDTREHSGAAAKDSMSVEVRTLAGTLLLTVATFTNLDATDTGEYVERGRFDLTGFAGQSVQLVFKAVTDDALTTAFRIDDASMTARVPKGDRGSPPPATAVTAPADGSTVSGTVTVSAKSTPGSAEQTVTRTETSVDGGLLGGASGQAVSLPWDTAS